MQLNNTNNQPITQANRRRAPIQLNIAAIEALLHRSANERVQLAEIQNQPIVVQEEPQESHPFAESLRRTNNGFEVMTNFSEAKIEDLYQRSFPFIAQSQKRGSKPKITFRDGWILYLSWAANAWDYEKLANLLNVTSACIEECLKRMRPIIYETLFARWFERRARPVPLTQTNYPYIGLISDSTTIQCYRPTGPFHEAKKYYDTHNHMYGIKKEVAVMAHAPYYALFTSEHFVGSVHDYNMHKQVYHQYVQYLMKKTNEAIPTDSDPRWAILMDSGYTGPAEDTPEERRIHIQKPSLSSDDRRNRDLSSIRVHVECFFGRLWIKWGILRNTYRWDHSHFDMDFDICTMLTNETIEFSNLNEADRAFYLNLLHIRTNQIQQKKGKRKSQQQAYLARKRERRN